MGDDIDSGSVCFDFRSNNVVQLRNRKYVVYGCLTSNDHRRQPVNGPGPMSLPVNHLSWIKIGPTNIMS